MLLSLAGCGGSNDGDGVVDVYAAASLAEVLPELDPAARYSFAGSDALAAQIREGAPADVFAAASSKYAQELYEEGLVDEPVAFASNRLVLVVPPSNPAGIESPEDLLDDGTRLVLAAEGVPVGDYARDALAALTLSDALANVVSNEDDAKGVSSKVALGEADAGIVYATDAAALGARIRVIELPERAQPSIEYLAAVVSESDDAGAARALVELLTTNAGRTALERAGFVAP